MMEFALANSIHLRTAPLVALPSALGTRIVNLLLKMVDESHKLDYTIVIMEQIFDGCIKALAQYQGEKYQNSFIGKIQWVQLGDLSGDPYFTSKILRERHNFQQLLIQVWNQAKQVGEMQVELMFFGPDAVKKASVKEQEPAAFPQGAHYWTSFSRQQVTEFSRITGDDNRIHLTEHPVVQGLMLWRELCVFLQPRFISIAFHHPVIAGEKIYFKEEEINEYNEREFTALCGRFGKKWEFGTGHDYQRRLCSAFSGVGVHFFSAALYTGHGDGTDHYGESGSLPVQA